MLERTRNNWKTWKQLLMTELSVKELSDVLDPSIEPPAGLTSSQIKNHKNTVRGIMISHLVEIYQDQVVDIEDPVEMFDKLQKSKRDEVNETSLAVTDQLNHLRFEIAKEPFVDFERRFNEVVRKYELVAGEPLNERIQTDAFYRAVSYSIPSLKTATYADRARGKSDGFSIAEIKVFAQNFESENKNSVKQMRSGDAMMIYTAKGKLICRGCGDTGHIQAKCPNPNKKRCYKCQQLGKHKADSCPFADGKEMNGPYIPPLRRNFKPRFNNNNYQNCRYRPYNSNNSGQFRRKNYNNNGGHNNNYRNNGNFNRRPYYNNNNNTFNGNKPKNNNSYNHNHDNHARFNQNKRKNTQNNNQNRDQYTKIENRPNNNKQNHNKNNNNRKNNQSQANMATKDDSTQMLVVNVRPPTTTPVTGCYMVRPSTSKSKVSNDNLNELHITFIADSGASDHLVSDPRILSNYAQINETIRCANKSTDADIQLRGVGDIYVKSNMDNPVPFKLTNVKYSKNVAENLMSLRKFVECGYTISLSRKDIKIIDPTDGSVFLQGKYEAPHWIIDLQLINSQQLKNERITLNYFKNTSNSKKQILSSGGAEGLLEPKESETEIPESENEIPESKINEPFRIETEKPNNNPDENSPDESKIINPKNIQDELDLDKPKVVIVKVSEEVEDDKRIDT